MANEAAAGGRDSIWTDLRFRSILAQTLVFGLAVLFLFALTYNAARNMGSLGKEISFWFLTQPAGFDIPLTLIPYSPTSPVLDVYFVGLLNTLLVSSLGCALATMLGFVLAMMRLSRNWLLSRIVYCYVEFMRNIPLLLQIIFWYAILLGLPRWSRADSPWFGFYLNNRGLFGPAPDLQPAFWWAPAALFAAAAAAVVLRRWARARQETTGETFPVFWTSLALLAVLPLAAYFLAGQPVELLHPRATRFNLRGGMVIRPEFIAILLALTLYTGAFISEIVRAGVLAVHKGQTEAALALGLRRGLNMRLIIIPQAMRVIIPPLTSQYLNLTKNSSLAYAVGFAELFAVYAGIALNQTGKEIEIMAMTMATYLVISLLISAFMNWYNKRVKLTER